MATGDSRNNRAVFLDRDGTIIEDVDYLSRPGQVKLLPGAAWAIKELREIGFKIVIVTNQSGVARGYFSEEDVSKVNEYLGGLLEKEGAQIDGFYYCPHLENCKCRKPETGMADRAAEEMALDKTRSYVVGDKVADVELASNMGATGILVLTGHGADERNKFGAEGPAYMAEDIKDAAQWIIGRENKEG